MRNGRGSRTPALALRPLAAAAATLAFLAPPAAPAASGPGAAHRVSAAEARLARSFWTPERMREAKPRPAPASALTATAAPPRAPVIRHGRVARGAPTLVPGRPPAGRNPFSSVIDDPSEEPFRTHGRIFGRFDHDKFTCSGTVINTPSNMVVLTAGHCLHERGVWAKRVVFVPGYDGGRRPYGNFYAKTLWVLRGWLNENFNFDVGLISLRANNRGKVGKVVGARGWATGVGRDRIYEAFGYPAGAAEGRELRFCRSPYLGDDRSTYRDPGPPTMRINCNMAGGSSGGGWIFGDEYANGVISYGYAAQRDRLYGPYFGAAVKRLIRRVGG